MAILRLPIAIISLIYQSAVLALGQIWANKTRSMLTTLGIVIGIASVTAVIAALSGLKKNVLTEFETFGTNKIFVFPAVPDEGRWRRAGYKTIMFRPEMFDGMLEHCPSVKTFTRLSDNSETISYGSKSEDNVEIVGIEPSWHEIENRTVVLGRPFSLIDERQAQAVCLINSKVQERLGLDRDPTGQAIIIGDRRFRIVGVVEDRVESSMFGGGGLGLEVLVPFTTLRRGRDMWMHVIAASRSPDVSDEARAEITFFLRRQRGLGVGEPNTFRVDAVEKFLQQFNAVAVGITMVATGVVGISLLVGGVGIMNIMLVSVSERTREIGLRKAVGAKPSAILLQFLVEATMLCLLGGLFGVLAGQGLVEMMKKIPNAQLDKAYIPGWALLLSFGFSALVGLVFGMFPAAKAARLDPIEALRHE